MIFKSCCHSSISFYWEGKGGKFRYFRLPTFVVLQMFVRASLILFRTRSVRVSLCILFALVIDKDPLHLTCTWFLLGFIVQPAGRLDGRRARREPAMKREGTEIFEGGRKPDVIRILKPPASCVSQLFTVLRSISNNSHI